MVWIVGSFVVIRRRQARQPPRGTEAPATPAGPLPETNESSSINTASNDSLLTPQQIVIVIMVFVLATGTFAAVLLMLRGLPTILLNPEKAQKDRIIQGQNEAAHADPLMLT